MIKNLELLQKFKSLEIEILFIILFQINSILFVFIFSFSSDQ